MEGEGDVFNHHQAVSNSNTGEDEVDRVGPHVPVGQHQDVQYVEHCPDTTNHNCQYPMVGEVAGLDWP